MKFYLYNKEHPYQASPFAVSVDGVSCSYRDSDAIPLVITLGGRVCFGVPGSEHHEVLAHIGETQSRAEGRFWMWGGVLSFWDEEHDITNENIKLVINALRDRFKVDSGDIRMFLDCQYDQSKRADGGLIVEISPAEYLSMNVPFGQNRQYFWDLYIKRAKLSGEDGDKVAGNGMLKRDVWRHYQNVGEGKVGSKVIISEDRLKEIIVSVLKEHLSERGTNLESLYHFTDVNGLDGILRTGRFNLSSWQKDIRGGKNYMSFTRHKSPLEGFAAPNESLVRVEVSSDVLNSMHDKSIDSYEYYSPEHAKTSDRCDPWRNSYQSGENKSAKAAYHKEMAKGRNKYRDEEFLNQAEESLTSGAEFINAEKAIKRIDICTYFNKGYCDSYKKEIYYRFSDILQSVNSPLYKKIFIYDNMRDFSLQTDNCIPISQYSEEALRNDLGLNDITQRTVAESI